MFIMATQKLSFIETLEDKLYDYRFKIRGPIKPPQDIVIVAIDEKSIERLGRWPWSRDKIAHIVNKLNGAGASLIVFDVMFTEREINDKILAASINNAGNVIIPIVFDFLKDSKASHDGLNINAYQSIVNPEGFDKCSTISAKSVLVPIPEAAAAAMALGHINMLADRDGTLRWETMAIEYEGYLYPPIGLHAASLYLGIPRDRTAFSVCNGIVLGSKRDIPTDRHGRMLINYYGPSETFPYISISDILEDKIGSDALGEKIVLIGATAKGIFDLRVTPFTAEMPGVEKHASVIASIIDGRFINAVSENVNLTILLLSGLLFSLLVSRYKAIVASLITLAFCGTILLSGYLLFVQKGLWLNITYPLLNVIFIFITVTAYRYAVEERYARRIRSMFSSYVTERVVNELIKNPGMARLGGERREITVLFSDVRGFTSFSEKHSPEDVVSILNEYLGEMTDIVFKWEGTLDKFIGDAILAFWNAPMKQEDHAELAVKCALNMVNRLQQLQKRWQDEGKPALDCGIGINTGEVIVGNIGAEGKKMDYTVIGDHVNLGSRIESLTRKYDTHIIISEYTLGKIREKVERGGLGHIYIGGLEKVIVKGKEKPVTLYELKPLPENEKTVIVESSDKEAVKLTEK
jgi:adenylate cyclase